MVIIRAEGKQSTHVFIIISLLISFHRLITMLHALHRSTYMGERTAYYERRQEVFNIY
jgi:hypothetical protein